MLAIPWCSCPGCDKLNSYQVLLYQSHKISVVADPYTETTTCCAACCFKWTVAGQQACLSVCLAQLIHFRVYLPTAAAGVYLPTAAGVYLPTTAAGVYLPTAATSAGSSFAPCAFKSFRCSSKGSVLPGVSDLLSSTVAATQTDSQEHDCLNPKHALLALFVRKPGGWGWGWGWGVGGGGGGGSLQCNKTRIHNSCWCTKRLVEGTPN